MDYTGYKQIHLTDDELTQFYSTAILPYEFLENESVAWPKKWWKKFNSEIWKEVYFKKYCK